MSSTFKSGRCRTSGKPVGSWLFSGKLPCCHFTVSRKPTCWNDHFVKQVSRSTLAICSWQVRPRSQGVKAKDGKVTECADDVSFQEASYLSSHVRRIFNLNAVLSSDCLKDYVVRIENVYFLNIERLVTYSQTESLPDRTWSLPSFFIFSCFNLKLQSVLFPAWVGSVKLRP